MKIFKPTFWDKKDSLIGLLLLPISFLLQVFIALKKNIFKSKKVAIPVICVGNIYVGGTGKTPLSIEIIKILKKHYKKAAIVKKSYKEHQDEFKLIRSKNVMLFKHSSRLTAINEAIKEKFDCVVLDDGFQDFSINKDVSIICFNERQLVGNGMTLPSGPLRESLSSLGRCQIVVINGDKNIEFENKIKNIANNIKIYYSKYLPTNVDNFRNQNLLAFAGIGNPINFFNILEKNNLTVAKKISFPDHYSYSLKELYQLIDLSVKNNLKIITTEKDFFRISHFQLSQIKYLNLELKILDENRFEKELVKYLW